jgi:hypothetical protein
VTAVRRDAVALAFVALCAVVLAGLCAGCGNKYTTAYRSLGAVREGAALAERALTDTCKGKVIQCERDHPTDRAAYLACADPCRKAGESWTRVVRPAINSALLVGVAAVDSAYQAKVSPSASSYLAPVACALARALELWGHLLPPPVAAAVRAVCGAIELGLCPRMVTP